MLSSCLYLFAQIAGIFEQVINSVGLLALLCNLGILTRQGEVGQDVHHDLWETVTHYLSPVLLKTPADRLHLLKVIQKDQVGNEDPVGRP